MSVISTGSFAKDLLPLVSEFYGMEYDQYDEIYSKIFQVLKSGRAFEEDTLTSGLDVTRQINEGGAVEYDNMQQGATSRYNHIKYGTGFKVTEEAQEDGKALSIAKMGATEMAWAVRQGKEIVGAQILNRAFDGNFSGADGVELCSALHPTRSANVSNTLSSAADLSEASIEQMFIDSSDWKNDRGLRIMAELHTLVIPRGEIFEAQRLLRSELRPGTADNDLNATKSMGLLQSGQIMNPFLTDADAFFLLSDVPNGLKYYTRREARIDTDNDMDTSNASFKVTARYVFGWSNFRGIIGSPGV